MTAVKREVIGWAGEITLRPGQAASDVYGMRNKLASVFDVHGSSVILTPGSTERRLGIEVYSVNPLQTAPRFTAPTLDLATGQCVVGYDTMGSPVHWRFWRPGWGACHGLVFGTSGAGKSSLLSMLMTEVRHSGVGVVWFFDPEEGLSAPPWIDAANFYAGVDEDGGLGPITSGLGALAAVWAHRRKQLAAARHTWQGPTEEFPLIFVPVDEAPDVLADPVRAGIMKWLLRKGRKVGISLVVIAQVPSLTELGGDQAIRSQAAGVNVLAFRTSDRMSAAMGMPKALPVDPATLPEEWPDGSSTAGLAYVSGGQMVRTLWLPDDDAWSWAQSGAPADLDEGSARAAGGDYLRAWLLRHGRADEAAAVQDAPPVQPDNVTAIEDASSGSLRERLVLLLTDLGTATTGVLHARVAVDGRPDLTQVSRALRKAADRGEIRDDGHRRWGAITTDEAADAVEGN
jgi:hypothetical protein